MPVDAIETTDLFYTGIYRGNLDVGWGHSSTWASTSYRPLSLVTYVWNWRL